VHKSCFFFADEAYAITFENELNFKLVSLSFYSSPLGERKSFGAWGREWSESSLSSGRILLSHALNLFFGVDLLPAAGFFLRSLLFSILLSPQRAVFPYLYKDCIQSPPLGKLPLSRSFLIGKKHT